MLSSVPVKESETLMIFRRIRKVLHWTATIYEMNMVSFMLWYTVEKEQVPIARACPSFETAKGPDQRLL